jgi:hypothetical protein
MFNFINQITSGAGNMMTGALQICTSPLALIQDICGGFGSQSCSRWMGSPSGCSCCGSGSYDPYGSYQHEATQNARISSLERRVAYDEAMVSYRLARGSL